MSATQYTSPLQQPIAWHPSPNNYEQVQLPPLNESGRVVFTRQLWQRTMPDENQSEQGVSDKSHTAIAQGRNNSTASSRRTSSSISLRSRNRSPSPSRGSKTPLTPEESPPFQNTRKRSAGAVEQEDRSLSSSNTSPAHTRANSGESTAHVCICQPDPKIPRPRNGM
jgi:HMG box factor